MTQPSLAGLPSLVRFYDLARQFTDIVSATAGTGLSPCEADEAKPLVEEMLILQHEVSRFLKPPLVTSQRVRDLLYSRGCIVSGHFVGTNYVHFNDYVAKDRGALFNSLNSEVCLGGAQRFSKDDIDVVVGPALGEISLAAWTAHHLSWLRPERPEVLSTFAQQNDEILMNVKRDDESRWIELPFSHKFQLQKGEKLILRRPGFILRPDFVRAVKGKRVLVVVNVFTTGGTAKRTAEAVVAAGGIVVGVVTWVDRGNVTAKDLGVPRFESLYTIKSEVWTEEECLKSGPCSQGVQPSVELGHGKEFLARRAA